MVTDTGATPRPGGIRPLDAPQLVQVDVGEGDIPTGVRLKPSCHSLENNPSPRPPVSPLPWGEGPGGEGRPSKGRWRKVLEVLDIWRIDDEWWRKQPVSRLYYRVVLEDGTMTSLFKDLISDQWYQQRV